MDNQNVSENQNLLFLNEPIRLFLEMCLWEKGIRDIDEKVKAEMVAELAGDFQEYLLQAIFAKLGESDLPAWKALMEQNPEPQTVLSFFKSKLPDFDKIVEDTMAEFKNVYVGA